MRALIVGAGAVGQVFGYHLAKGGAQVAFLVKAKYVDECRRGFALYPLPKTEPVRFDGSEIVTAASAGYDQIYLTVSSTALKAGTWLAELARASGDATVVVLQPGLVDRAFVAEHVAEDRIVDGTINFLSYHAPMPGETRFAAPGMAYWFFPGKAPFSCSRAGPRAADVVAALAAGGMPAKRVRDVPRTAAFPSAILGAFVAALEAADWSFSTMRARGFTKLGARAAREAMRVVEHERGVRRPFGARLAARGLAFRALLRLAPRIAPVDLETYMRVHFTKVGDQMHDSLAHLIARGHAAALPVESLEELAKRLPEPT